MRKPPPILLLHFDQIVSFILCVLFYCRTGDLLLHFPPLASSIRFTVSVSQLFRQHIPVTHDEICCWP